MGCPAFFLVGTRASIAISRAELPHRHPRRAHKIDNKGSRWVRRQLTVADHATADAQPTSEDNYCAPCGNSGVCCPTPGGQSHDYRRREVVRLADRLHRCAVQHWELASEMPSFWKSIFRLA